MQVRGDSDGRVQERRLKAGWLAACLAIAGAWPWRGGALCLDPLIEGLPWLCRGDGSERERRGRRLDGLLRATTFWIWRNGQRETHEFGGGYSGFPRRSTTWPGGRRL